MSLNFERERIRERQAEGISAAKAKGVYRGGKTKFSDDEIRRLRAEGMGITEIARRIGAAKQSRPKIKTFQCMAFLLSL